MRRGMTPGSTYPFMFHFFNLPYRSCNYHDSANEEDVYAPWATEPLAFGVVEVSL
jgi:hypothetical protein